MLIAVLCLLWSSLSLAAIVGIDLGHQYTKAIMVAPGLSFDIVATDEGKRKDLNAISLRPHVEKGELIDADRVFGSKIGSLCSRFPESCAANIKALLGKSIDDKTVNEYLERHHGVNLAANKVRNNSVSLKLGDAASSFEFPVEELMAMTLNELKDRVISELKNHPQAKAIAEDVAVSIAPYASQAVRNAYLDAVQLANYSTVLGLVDEGTAVARGYIASRKVADEDLNNQTVHHVIYDSGAGSTTATLFSYTLFENHTIALDIQSVGYDDSFGGELLTKSVYDLLFTRYLEEFKLPKKHSLSPKLASRLTEAAEKAKIILSANTEYKVHLENFPDDRDFKTVITREEFENANADIKKRVADPIIEALKNSPSGPKSVDDIKSVILNGGSTRVPFVQRALSDFLGTEDKLAKTVNADEACALGTTVRGYELKMITSNPYNILLTDRIFSDFELSVDGAPYEPIFPRGSPASSTVKKSLGPVSKKTKSVGLLENGKLFKTYSLENTLSKAKTLNCKLPEVFGVFEVDQNKIFSLSSLTVECLKVEEEETTTSEDPTEETSSRGANATTPKKSKSPVKVSLIVPDAKFSTLHPLSKNERRTSADRLAQLKKKDHEKVKFAETKNLAESVCYDLRSYLEDHHDDLRSELGIDRVEKFETIIGETLEWLDYESDQATVEQLKEKYEEVSEYKKEAENAVNMLTADLSLETIKKLHEEGKEISTMVETYLLEYESQLKEVRSRYEKAGFDFDVEDDKIMKKLYGSGTSEGTKLDAHYKEFKEALKALSNTLGLSKSAFNKKNKKELFDEVEKVKGLIMKMIEDVLPLQLNHEKRLEYLLSKLDTKTKQKEQKEAKKKAKEAEASKKAAETTESETSVTEASSETATTDVESQQVDLSEATKEVHDEL